MRRPLNQIAAEVMTNWIDMQRGKTNSPPNFMFHARPYLDALFDMEDISQPYGLEEGVFVVLYFLNNVQPWRGDVARQIKAELNEQVKEFNEAHHR